MGFPFAVGTVFYAEPYQNVAQGAWTFRYANTSAQSFYTGHFSNVSQPLFNGDLAPVMGRGTMFGAKFFLPFTDNLGHLQGATYDGSWTVLPIETATRVWPKSYSIVFNNTVYVFYGALDYSSLYVASSTDLQNWSIAQIDGTGGPTGGHQVMEPTAVVYNNVLRVYYLDRTNNILREASTPDGVSWSYAPIDGAGGSNGRVSGDVGQNATTVVGTAGLFVFYYAEGSYSLRYGLFDGTQWTSFGVVDGGLSNTGSALGQISGQVDTGGSSAVEWNGVPHVYYTIYNNGTGSTSLREASWNGSSFNAQYLDGAPSANACGTSAVSGDISGLEAPQAVSYTPFGANSLIKVYYGSSGGTLKSAVYSYH
jgi:hypothetical protein